MLNTSQFRNGLKIELNDTPYEIIEFLHFKPGKGGAMIRTKLRNLLNGRVTDQTFRSGEKVKKPDLATQEMQFLYKEGENFVLMDMESYEQVYVQPETFGRLGGFLKEGMELQTLVYNGTVIDLELPASITFEVTDTEPGIQGDRVSGATKPATIETGITVQVPLFINTGDTIKVDTRSGDYIGRE